MVTSWMPRTSPTFQSCFGLSGCELWQLTQACPMTTGAIRRTRSLKADRETSADLLVRIGTQRGQRALLEVIENMRRAILERIVGHKAIVDVLLLLADHLAELERQGRGNRDGAGDRLIVVRDLRGARPSASTRPTTLVA